MKHYCPYCNSVEKYRVEKRIIEEYKGIKVDVEEKVTFCEKCGNEIIVNNIEDDNLVRLYARYRELQGTVSSEDIVKLREKYNLSQRELTGILGWGKMTINRYENGSLPTKSHSDYLIDLIKDEKRLLEKAKMAYEKKQITEKTFDKLVKNEKKDTDLRGYLEKELVREPNIYNGYKQFDIDKVENLISYIASKVDNLYLTSLNKYLWFIDMVSFQRRAVGITGLTYMKEQFGPVIVGAKYEELSKLEDKYKREDSEKNDGGLISKIKSKGNFDLSDFTENEMEIVDEVIELLKDKSVKEISDLSHKELGWKKTERFKRISFEFAEEMVINERKNF
ncbi:MAG: DUF4065 domain-containing protein [Clostridia bacterium]|nr:DUF4065 domain-containing protein [Clostridia bacterium]